MNTLHRTTPVIAVGALLLAVSLGACSSVDGAESSTDTTAPSSSAIEALEAQLAALGLSDDYDIDRLTQAEIDGLVFMREEEKLAHDVYVALYEQWDLAIFDNISQIRDHPHERRRRLARQLRHRRPGSRKRRGRVHRS